MTEELVTGTDYDDLLYKGHLALTAAEAPSSGAAATNFPGPALLNVGLPHMPDTTWLDNTDTSLTAGLVTAGWYHRYISRVYAWPYAVWVYSSDDPGCDVGGNICRICCCLVYQE